MRFLLGFMPYRAKSADFALAGALALREGRIIRLEFTETCDKPKRTLVLDLGDTEAALLRDAIQEAVARGRGREG